MSQPLRFTSAGLDAFPNDGKRYEIIDGELYVSNPSSLDHQVMCVGVVVPLDVWSTKTHSGSAIIAPGLVFAEDDDVAPDVVWISDERLKIALDAVGHLHAAPELVVEVLSPGAANARRDRDLKLKLYSRRGVREYWIVDWQRKGIEVYRRSEAALALAATLSGDDVLESPLLPGFALPLSELFARLPAA